MQQMLQNLQFQYGIYNSDIEPEHDSDYPCSCPIHQCQRAKWTRYGVQDMWSKAVMYPGKVPCSPSTKLPTILTFQFIGEKAYNDNKYTYGGSMGLFNRNPYQFRVVSPYAYNQWTWDGPPRPKPLCHATV